MIAVQSAPEIYDFRAPGRLAELFRRLLVRPRAGADAVEGVFESLVAGGEAGEVVGAGRKPDGARRHRAGVMAMRGAHGLTIGSARRDTIRKLIPRLCDRGTINGCKRTAGAGGNAVGGLNAQGCRLPTYLFYELLLRVSNHFVVNKTSMLRVSKQFFSMTRKMGVTFCDQIVATPNLFCTSVNSGM